MKHMFIKKSHVEIFNILKGSCNLKAINTKIFQIDFEMTSIVSQNQPIWKIYVNCVRFIVHYFWKQSQNYVQYVYERNIICVLNCVCLTLLCYFRCIRPCFKLIHLILFNFSFQMQFLVHSAIKYIKIEQVFLNNSAKLESRTMEAPSTPF